MWNKLTVIYFAGVSLIALVAGCAAERPASLARAQASLQQAKQIPAVEQYAPTQLSEAQATLTRAQQVWNEDGDRDETSHLAYLAEQRAGIAVAMAQQKAAEEQVQQLRSEARTQELQLARQRAQNLEQQLTALQAKKTERGIEMSLDSNVLFDYNESQLKPGARLSLEPLVTFLRDYPDRTLMIEGHTDSTGSSDYNHDLSQRRADAVRNFLISNGIASDRVQTRGYGEAFPIASNGTVAGRQLNRRVEVVIANDGQQVAERR